MSRYHRRTNWQDEREADDEVQFAAQFDLSEKPIATKQGDRAAIDANAGHDSGGTEREIRGDPRHGENPYEQLARGLKAQKLADALVSAGITAEEASRMTPQHWLQAAQVAHVNPPSAATIEATLQLMRFREK